MTCMTVWAVWHWTIWPLTGASPRLPAPGPVDRGKQGTKRSVLVDAAGIPLGTVVAAANDHDSPLLAPTLDTLACLGPLPDPIAVHLDCGYDSASPATPLPPAGSPAASPPQASLHRSPPATGGASSAPTPGTTPTRSSRGAPNAAPRSAEFYLALTNVIIIVRQLIRQAWTLYRWNTRPHRRP